MIYKNRKIPIELDVLSFLQSRVKMNPQDRQHYIRLKKGFEGETQFDQLIESLDCDHLILNDLMLDHQDTVFQVDSLLITPEKIILYEIKNYQGEFVLEDDRLYKLPQQELVNPLHQLGRTVPLLRQLLRKIGFNIPIQPYVVFVNPNFTLFIPRPNPSIILPTQINHHINQLNNMTSNLKPTHHQLAKQLCELHHTQSRFTKIPTYPYEKIKRGIFCSECGGGELTLEGKGRNLYCGICKYCESADQAVIRLAKSLLLLFPDKQLTTSLIVEWSNGLITQKRTKRILDSNFKIKGTNRWRYYE